MPERIRLRWGASAVVGLLLTFGGVAGAQDSGEYPAEQALNAKKLLEPQRPEDIARGIAPGHGHEGAHPHLVRGEAPPEDVLKVDAILFAWTLVLFLGLSWLLNKYAWQPMLAAFRERDERVADALRQSELLRAEAHALAEQQDREMGAAHEEVRRMLDEVRTEASRDAEALIAKAKADAQKERNEATAAIEDAKREAVASLQESSFGLAAQMVSRFTGRTVDVGTVRGMAEGKP